MFFTSNIMLDQPGWVVRRARDLRTIYMDNEHFHKGGTVGLSAMIGEDWEVMPTELDPPRHGEYRKAFNPNFAPSAMVKLDAQVRERAREITARIRKQGGCEFVSAFAVSFPISIFLDMMGLPQDQLDDLLRWENDFIRGTDRDVRTASVRAVRDLLVEAIAERRRNPGDDLISRTLSLQVEGRPLTDKEALGHCFNLYLGGLDTVTANLTLHFLHLSTHLADQKQIRANTPAENVHAVEELLRAYAAVTNVRICVKECEVAGEEIRPGEFVALSTPLAGRDPEEYEDPQTIRLDRRPSHVSLGHGIHRCLGQHLARRELQIAMEEFTRAVPPFELETGFAPQYVLGNVIQVPELKLVW